MYSNSIHFGPNVPIQGVLSGQCIYYMSTWTLRDFGRLNRCEAGVICCAGCFDGLIRLGLKLWSFKPRV